MEGGYIQLWMESSKTGASAKGLRLTRYGPRAIARWRVRCSGRQGAKYLEWVGLLGGCVALEAYCKAHTAEIHPLRVAEFLLLNPEFPRSIRFSVDRVNAALHLIRDLTQRGAKLPTRIAGRLRAQLSFSQIDEIMAEGVHTYLQTVRKECAEIHAAIHENYFDYSIEAELAS
jgi:uncharacterized alpha-E superfamily protein